MDVTEITSIRIKELALDLHKNHKSSTKNRQVLTPARAVLYHAHELGWRTPMRIRNFKEEKSNKHSAVSRDWLSKFLKESDRSNLFHLSALVLFMNHTGARVSEGVELEWRNVDLFKRFVVLERTKTDKYVKVYLTDELVFRLYNLREQNKPLPTDKVFMYCSRHSVHERIRAVCKRALLDFHSSHSIGRYSFATNAINMGANIKMVMDAGRWKSSKVFLETYVQTDEAGRAIADKFNSVRYQTL